jgi:hypothetical protein
VIWPGGIGKPQCIVSNMTRFFRSLCAFIVEQTAVVSINMQTI